MYETVLTTYRHQSDTRFPRFSFYHGRSQQHLMDVENFSEDQSIIDDQAFQCSGQQ